MDVVLGYVRVSSVDQTHGFGPEVQAAKIRECAQRMGLPAPEISYESKSGESITKRAELHLVLQRAEDAQEGGAQAHIIFAGLDRLSRDLIDQESVYARCMERGIRLYSAQESENESLDPKYAGDPMRTAIRQFFGIIHQLDRAIVQRRMDSGLVAKATKGGFTGGRPPFGYLAVNGDLQVDQTKVQAIRLVFGMLDRGINAKAVADIIKRSHPGLAAWCPSLIYRIKNNRELYEQGIYRPRLGLAAVMRSDLRMLDVGQAHRPDGRMPIDWDSVPDLVDADVLGALLGISVEEIVKAATVAGLPVKCIKSKKIVSKTVARSLGAA